MNIEIEIEHGADIASGVDIEGITQYVLEQEGWRRWSMPLDTVSAICFIGYCVVNRLFDIN